MKKLILMLLVVFAMSILFANQLKPFRDLDLSYAGELRNRAILVNDVNKDNGGWFDNRMRFDLAAKLADKMGVTWTTEIGYIEWGGAGGGYSTGGVNLETRELYLDYMMNCMNAKIRIGQQYWADHRSLILDDYFSGITANMDVAGIPAEFGFIKGVEGSHISQTMDDAHAVFANFTFKAPVDWGITAMFGQDHTANTADIWVMPYFMLNFEPVSVDLTAVIDQQTFPENLDGDDSAMGIAFAGKVDVDLGVKLGAEVLYVTEDGINALSPYYGNGLYLFGKQDNFDGTSIDADYNWGENFMAMVFKAAYPMNEKMDIFGAVGMASADDPIGTELNIGMNYKILDKLTFTPVLAIGQTGEKIDTDENMVYMLGGVLNTEF